MNSNDLNNIDFSSIKYVFAKPLKEGYYMYSINNVTNLLLIPKENLKTLIIKLGYDITNEKLDYLMDRYFPFLFICENKTLKSFELTGKSSSKEEIFSKIKESMQIKNTTSFSQKYKKLFGFNH